MMASRSSLLVKGLLGSLWLLLLLETNPVVAVEFPAPIEKCHVTDEKCILEQSNKFIQTYPNGLAPLGMPDLEPLHLEKLNILGDEKSAASFNLYMTDLKFYNYSTLVIDKMRGFSKDTSKPMKIISHSTVPQMTMRAKYKITGKILVLPITGEGDLEWVITGTDAKTVILLNVQEREGKTYLKIEDYKLMSKSKNVKVHMTNLFNGDKALSENMLKLLNDNWQLLSADIQPQIDQEMARQFRIFITKFFNDVPYEEMFLPE